MCPKDCWSSAYKCKTLKFCWSSINPSGSKTITPSLVPIHTIPVLSWIIERIIFWCLLSKLNCLNLNCSREPSARCSPPPKVASHIRFLLSRIMVKILLLEDDCLVWSFSVYSFIILSPWGDRINNPPPFVPNHL